MDCLVCRLCRHGRSTLQRHAYHKVHFLLRFYHHRLVRLLPVILVVQVLRQLLHIHLIHKCHPNLSLPLHRNRVRIMVHHHICHQINHHMTIKMYSIQEEISINMMRRSLIVHSCIVDLVQNQKSKIVNVIVVIRPCMLFLDYFFLSKFSYIIFQ